jgi:hypothetical protein
MAHRKTLDAVLAIVVAWGVLFGVPFFVPQIAPFALQIGIITTVILAIFSVIYFYPTGEETSPTQVEVKLRETVPVASEDDLRLHVQRLRAYSPIHLMITAINMVSPRDAALKDRGVGIGRFVRLDAIPNLDDVRAAFSEQAHILGDHHLKEWLKLDKLIKEDPRGGFWVGKSEWKWFDELEREYQDAAKANLSQTAPEIVVNVDQPLACEPKNLTHLLRKEVPSLQVYLYQCLTVKARTVTVKSLMAKTWIDGRAPYYLNWAPKPSEQTSENPKRVDLFPEEEVQLPIWYAAKQVFGPKEGFPVQLTIVSDDVFESAELDRLENPIIGIAIQFIAENYTDPKPRQFKLNAKSWDELSLTERR